MKKEYIAPLADAHMIQVSSILDNSKTPLPPQISDGGSNRDTGIDAAEGKIIYITWDDEKEDYFYWDDVEEEEDI